MQACLVAAKVDMNVPLNTTLPKFNDVPYKTDRDGLARLGRFHHHVNGFVNGMGHGGQPTLFVALVRGVSVRFCNDAGGTCDGRCFCLCTGHSTKSAGDEGHAR